MDVRLAALTVFLALGMLGCGRVGYDASGLASDGGLDGSIDAPEPVDSAVTPDGRTDARVDGATDAGDSGPGCALGGGLNTIDCEPRDGCPSEPICTGLVALLHFDNVATAGETPTLAHDFSDNGNDATCTAPDCPTFMPSGGRFGGAYAYSEPDNFAIAHAPSVSISGAVTMSAWFFPNTLASNWRIIITKLQSAPLLANYGIPHNGMTFYVNYAASSGWQNHGSASSFTPGRWYHIVGVIDDDNDRMLLYVDGVVEHDMPETTPMEEDTGPVWIGWSPTNGGVDGIIDEVAIWNRALTPAEIAGLYPGSGGG